MTPPARAALAPAVVRIFGDNTDIIIDRAREIEAPALPPPHALHPPPPPPHPTPPHPLPRPPERIALIPAPGGPRPPQALIQLNAQGFGARVLGTFANGRIEALIPGLPLAPADMRRADIFPRVARLLFSFHSVAMAGARRAALWPLVDGWLALARGLSFEGAPAKQAAFDQARRRGAREMRPGDMRLRRSWLPLRRRSAWTSWRLTWRRRGPCATASARRWCSATTICCRAIC